MVVLVLASNDCIFTSGKHYICDDVTKVMKERMRPRANERGDEVVKVIFV